MEASIFHIHIDATELPKSLEDYVIKELGFYENGFSGHPPGYRHFEPNRHLTVKPKDRAEFNRIWASLSTNAAAHGLIGYIEGEYISSDDTIKFIPYKEAEVPFKIGRRHLSHDEKFRQTELHLVLDADESDPRLIQSLLESGLYGAYIPKKDHKAIVLTAQGYIKDVTPLIKSLRDYLAIAGGAKRCSLKEERALTYELFGIGSEQLPEVIKNIEYTT